MPLTIGQQIIYENLDSTEFLKTGTITKISGNGDLVYVDNQHKAEECILTAFCWPIEAREELIAVITERNRLKKIYDDSMSLIYQLRNKYSS
jgi:hypothetical protein